jgi:tripartite-type tricarboxylate transporter receptor subunit TctC
LLASPEGEVRPISPAKLFEMIAGINVIHVPYRGSGLALTNLNCVRVLILSMLAPIEVRAGKLRTLAVTGSSSPRGPRMDKAIRAANIKPDDPDAIEMYVTVGPHRTRER